MDPQTQTLIANLSARVAELEAWKEARTRQQIVAPLDDVSKAVLGAPIPNGAGSVPLTQSITISGAGQVITVPALYTGSRVLTIEGATYNIPYL